MLAKTTIALFVAAALGAASAALANDRDGYESGGFQVQTWQDVQQARKNIQDQIRSQYHTANEHGRDAYGSSAILSQKDGASAKPGHRLSPGY
jgi:hypothetical protein